MKRPIVAAALLALPMSALAEDGFHQFEFPGYRDLVRIPGSDFTVHQPDRPPPPRVLVAEHSGDCGQPAPSDATPLFDGSSLDHFSDNKWQVVDGILIASEGGLTTIAAYGDCQLHVEWKVPNPPTGKPANMGNSGIFFMGLYELQIYDSYSSRIYADGSAAAIYGQTPPLVNTCRPPGRWQSYDIIFTAPTFSGGELVAPARITVIHNGVVVHNRTEIKGPTAHRNSVPYKPHAAKLPVYFQGHGSPVEFSNIWIREL